MTIKDELTDFLTNTKPWPASRRWLHDDETGLQVYVRYTQRFIDNKRLTSFDIASSEVPPDKQGKGVFRKFLALLIELLDQLNVHCDIIYAENVLTVRFASFFERAGWQRDPMLPADRCYYRLYDKVQKET